MLAGGPQAGALLLAGLFVLDLFGPGVGYQGFRDPRAIAMVLERARATAIAQHFTIFLAMVGFGALFGAVGLLFRRAWAIARGRPPAGRGFLVGLVAALVGHGYLLARSVVKYPQLYSTQFHAPGGIRQSLMASLTDHLTPARLDGLMALVLAALVLPPLLSRNGRARLAALARALRRRPRLAVAGLVAIVVALGAAALVGPRRVAPTGRPNLVLIAVDSLRPDRVFGPDAPARFPALAGLAARGARFHQAHVTQARTFPSFVTLLTGRFPWRHGIRHEFPPAGARQAIGPTLASALAGAGYATSVVADYSGDIFPRTPLGFQRIDTPHLDLYLIVRQQILAHHTNVLPYAASRLGERLFPAMRAMAQFDDPALLAERAVAQLDRLAGQPFFLAVFFSAPHSPYVAPEPYYRRFTDRRYRGPFRYLKEPLPPLPVVPPEEARHINGLYDGAVAAVDAAVARLVRRIEALGLADDTIVVLLGDHGENLFDVPGRGMGHGDHLWGDLANHIPLVIVDPRRAPRDVHGIVRDVDLAPTLARRLGVAASPGDGVDLAPLLDGARDSLELESYQETGLWLLGGGPGYRARDRLPYPDLWHVTEAAADGDLYLKPAWEAAQRLAKYRALRTARYKLVYQPAPEGTHWRLFDLARDPAQRRDVAADHPAEVAELRARLSAFITADGTPLHPDAPP
jgi:arylsulfatase A-like enzyme